MNEVIETLVNRRSCKAYSARQVDETALQEILRAGLYAPSGMGRQSVTFVVLQDAAEIRALSRRNAAIMGAEIDPFYGAPTVVVVLAQRDVPTAVEDGSVALCNLMNAAAALGVDSCWIHRAREEFAGDEGKALLRRWGVAGEWVGIGHCLLGYRERALPPAAPRREGRIIRV